MKDKGVSEFCLNNNFKLNPTAKLVEQIRLITCAVHVNFSYVCQSSSACNTSGRREVATKISS